MRSDKRWNGALLLVASCLGLLGPALAASADENGAAKGILVLKLPRSGASTPAPGADTRPRAAYPVKSNVGRSVDPRLNDSLHLEAGKIIERATPGGNAAEAERTIELHTDVRLTWHDGPMTASADRAIVTVRYQDASKATVESLTVNLSGHAQWTRDGIAASADTLTLDFRPSAQTAPAGAPQTHWTVRGRARLKGKNFAARAERMEIARDDKEGQKTHLVLQDKVAFRYAGASGHGQVDGGRMELRLEGGALPDFSGLFDRALDGRKRR